VDFHHLLPAGFAGAPVCLINARNREVPLLDRPATASMILGRQSIFGRGFWTDFRLISTRDAACP
jgi:hypothetical protein